MKKIIYYFSLISLCLISLPLSADVSGAVEYLKTKTPDDWITMALVAASQTNVAKDHLQVFSGSVATDYAKRILAVKAVAEDPATWPTVNLVQGLKGLANNNQIGSVDLLNDDAWGIMALTAAGVSTNDPIIVGAKAYLLAHQNSDGGWGYNVGGESDTNDTAAVIMSLAEVGLSASDSAINNALTYLKNQQNSDGGLPFVGGSISDSGSTAWTIAALNKLGVSAQTWVKGGQNPLLFLQSLQLPDGSYKWQAGDSSGSPTMTAFAVLALTGKYFPVKASVNNPPTVQYRLEGSGATVCQGQVSTTTVLDVVKNAASACGYTYEIQITSYGPYLQRINNDQAAGTIGWMYMVNYQAGQIGAADYNLQTGDSVLWYFGEYTLQPLRLKLSKSTAQPGENITVISEKLLTSGAWVVEPAVTIKGLPEVLLTNEQGQAVFTMGTSNLSLWGEKLGGVRSAKEGLPVGQGVSQSVSLSVTVEPSITPPSDPSISFIVSNANLALGSVRAGEAVEKQITLTNTSAATLHLEAVVSGEAIFTDNLKLNQQAWDSWQTQLGTSLTTPIVVRLAVPTTYSGTGDKTGGLVFWAVARGN